ncbi:MAG: helicase RepA family protein, partial [Phycisphaerales bacterium]
MNSPFASLDLFDAFSRTPPPLDYIWSGFVLGTVGGLVAPGGTGKSFWALQAAMAIASEDAGADLLGIKPKHGRVVYVAAEDPQPVLHHRVHAIGSLLPPSARASIAGNLHLLPAMGAGIDVLQDEDLKKLIEAGQGARLIVLDTLSRMHRCDENDNGAAAAVISRLEKLAVTTGAAVLFLHHTGKAAAKEGQLERQHAARG